MTRRKIINNNERYTLTEAAQEFYKHNKTKGLSEAAQKQYTLACRDNCR